MTNKSVRDYADELQALQGEITTELEDLDRCELRYATSNERWSTVRRVLLRFCDHLREHTTQLRAAREDIGAAQSMPQRMLSRASEAYGALAGEMVGLHDADLDKVPEPGEWTPRQVLEHIVKTQTFYLDLIREARAKAEPVEKD